MVVDGVCYAEGIRTIKEINPDYFFVRIKAEMFAKWLIDNQSADGFVDLNLVRNNSEFFYAKKAELKEKFENKF